MHKQLIGGFFVFAPYQYNHCFKNPKYNLSSHLMWLHSPICVGPGRRPEYSFFSRRVSLNSRCSLDCRLISVVDVKFDRPFQLIIPHFYLMLICNTRFYLMLTRTSTTDQMRQSSSRNSDKHRHQSHSQMCFEVSNGHNIIISA